MSAKTTIRFPSEFMQSKKPGILLGIPENVGSKLAAQGSTPVEGIINHLPFRSTVVLDSTGKHWIKVDAHTYAVISKHSEGEVSVEITRLGEEVETRIPADLKKALMLTPKAKMVWDDITPIARRDWIFWIITGKLAETRGVRIEKACDMLSHGKRRVCCFAGINWLMKNS